MARADSAVVLAALGSDHEGLTDEQAQAIRERVGLNQVVAERPLHWWVTLWRCYRNPFNILLTALVSVSLLTHDVKAAVVIGSMVVLSTFLRFWQEHKSGKAADALKAMVTNTATVLRRPAMPPLPQVVHAGESFEAQQLPSVELPIQYLVPGDVVVLSAGDMIPADCRVLGAKDLFVSQAAMTGESMPVEKFARMRDAASAGQPANPLEFETLLFMGTNVVSGTATAVVIGTGATTCFGALAGRAAAAQSAPTAFQVGVNKVGWLLLRFTLVMTVLVFVINAYTKGDAGQALLFALSVAVGLTPEMLPMIVTSTLAKGAVFLSRQKVIVKRLDAIQAFGAMDVLCTDKTGTLSQDKIFLARHVDAWGQESARVLEMAYLNSYYQTGLKNLLDKAVLTHLEVHGELQPAVNYRKVDEIPFDFDRRRMSVVVAQANGVHLLITKGAADEILPLCTHVQCGAGSEPMTPQLAAQVRGFTAELNEQGMRVVAVATREFPGQARAYGLSDECQLTLTGYVAFVDPPKDSTAPALAALAHNGVTLKILTGDNERVTVKICREVGLTDLAVALGPDIEAMSQAELARHAETVTVFARLTPAHKERIVTALRANGHVVGFLGDGINDASALRAADIGISVDNAVDIAKEAADIILLEKSLMILQAGVLEGRRTFANMLKYIRMTASSNFGNVFSVLVASAFLPFLPMLPMHLLVQNLLYDISQIAIPFDRVDDDALRKPLHWRPDDIGRFMVYFGPVSSLFDLLTFAVMWFVFSANTPAEQTLFQSGWFVVGILTQTLVVHAIRTAHIPFVQSRASTPVMIMTATIVAVGIFLPMGPLAPYVKLQALPPLYFAYLPVILLAYLALTQVVKGVFRRRYGWQ
jgi:Mg2+-importing ATPase